MRFLTVLLCFGFWSSTVFADERTPKQILRAFLAESEHLQRGDVFSQATLDGVDYASLLRGAVAGRRVALAGLFRYTYTGKFMGEGAYSNASILDALLQQWGDERFAAVLQTLPMRVRRSVIAVLDEHFVLAAFRQRFPHTYVLAIHTPPA